MRIDVEVDDFNAALRLRMAGAAQPWAIPELTVLTFAGQNVGTKQTDDRIWLVSFMRYDLGYFDDETCRLEPLQSPFGPKVLPMSPE